MKLALSALAAALSLTSFDAFAQSKTCSEQHAVCANPSSEASRSFRGDRSAFCKGLKDTCMRTGVWQTGRVNLTGLQKR